jgi:hypothetical protein
LLREIDKHDWPSVYGISVTAVDVVFEHAGKVSVKD